MVVAHEIWLFTSLLGVGGLRSRALTEQLSSPAGMPHREFEAQQSSPHRRRNDTSRHTTNSSKGF